MRSVHSETGLLAEEPKNGDFVAYLAQIEKRQLASLPARAAHTAPTLTSPHSPHGAPPLARGDTTGAALTAEQAEAVRARLRQGANSARHLVGAALLGLIGLFFATQALLSDGGVVPLLIAGVLFWRAAVMLKRAAQAGVDGGVAGRLVERLRGAQGRR